MPEFFAKSADNAIPVHVVETAGLKAWLGGKPKHLQRWVTSTDFGARLGEILLVPGENNRLCQVIAGWGNAAERGRGRFHMARIAEKLPQNTYEIHADFTKGELEEASLAWLYTQYSFERYRKNNTVENTHGARLVPPKIIDHKNIEAIARAEFLVRDLINTPASDMGPEELQIAFEDMAKRYGVQSRAVVGEDLLRENLPMIHAVGRAAVQAPRLLEMRWGNPEHRKVTLVGKGVCFDTGGLNIKPGSSMGLMKKDMGGAATVMGLAQLIMDSDLPVHLHVLIPAVENAISGAAFRPQDVLTSRKGLTVEVNNTDAEGRLVLADALALADEDAPDLMICMATLTGAARVALGPDIAPYFTDDPALSAALLKASQSVLDPLWPMPFWRPYESMIEPDIADLDNAPKGGFAGAITAALFLRRFVETTPSFVHIDIYGWMDPAKAGRTKGGCAQGMRALFSLLEETYKK